MLYIEVGQKVSCSTFDSFASAEFLAARGNIDGRIFAENQDLVCYIREYFFSDGAAEDCGADICLQLELSWL